MITAVHVVPHIHAEASGPSYSVPHLCKALADCGENVQLHVLGHLPDKKIVGYKIYTHPTSPFLKQLGFSRAMHNQLIIEARHAHIMHNHSLWMMPNYYPAKAIRHSSCKLISSPHGTLSAYALQLSRWRKKIFWIIGQSKVLTQASCLHATSEQEYMDIRTQGLKQPVAIIPNGIEISDNYPQTLKNSKNRRLLFIGRFHRIKGLDSLLYAWANLETKFPDWELYIAGPDDGYKSAMIKLVQELQLQRVVIADPVYGNDKNELFASADLFILPSHSENFGMVVAEALAHGIPSIASTGTPWHGLIDNDCGWWIDNDVSSLSVCLKEAFSLSSGSLKSLGNNGREWMKRDFSWGKIGPMMHETYRWLLEGGNTPDWVRLD